jgi:hypothetical protein
MPTSSAQTTGSPPTSNTQQPATSSPGNTPMYSGINYMLRNFSNRYLTQEIRHQRILYRRREVHQVIGLCV